MQHHLYCKTNNCVLCLVSNTVNREYNNDDVEEEHGTVKEDDSVEPELFAK